MGQGIESNVLPLEYITAEVCQLYGTKHTEWKAQGLSRW